MSNVVEMEALRWGNRQWADSKLYNLELLLGIYIYLHIKVPP